MKVLRVVGLILGILLLLAGGGLLVGSVVADKSQSAVQQQIEEQGLKGPVQGRVVDKAESTYTVQFTADDGQSYTATAVSTLATPPEVGDTVTIFYKADDPSVAAITDAPTTALGKVAGTLRVAGIVTLVVGGVLLVASIVGFVVGPKAPKALPQQPYAAPGYPPHNPAQPQPGYPTPPSPYPPQPPSGT